MNLLSYKKIGVEIKLILVISIISCLVLSIKIIDEVFYKDVISHLAIYSDFKVFNFRVWQLLTYIFLHASILHLVFNMLMLYFFSMLFFTYFNKIQYLKSIFFGGLFAAIFYILIGNIFNNHGFAVGASGAIMALFFTIVGYNPFMRIQLIIFGNIPIYYVALAFIGYDILQLFFDNAGGHIIHLGGSIFGFVYGKYFIGIDFKKASKKQKRPSHLKAIRNNKNTTIIGTDNNIQKRIDVILDKISKSGYESLTQEEKEFLFKQK